MDGHFRKEMPRHFEFPREIPRRYAAVPHASMGRASRVSRCEMQMH